MTVHTKDSGIKLTIVGGEPSQVRRSFEPNALPEGIGKILRRAADDSVFKQRLLDDRESLLADCGIELTSSERAALNAVTASSLQAMIANIRS
jgi:hypothetical protein